MKHAIAVVALLLPAATTAQSVTNEPVFNTTGSFFALSVPDVEASSRWYMEKLGMRVVLEPPPQDGIMARVLEGGGLIVELIANPRAVPLSTAAPAITHTTLVHGIFKAGVIVDDLDKTLAALRERGVPIAMGPFPARAGQRANFIIRDGAGNLLQFFGR